MMCKEKKSDRSPGRSNAKEVRACAKETGPLELDKFQIRVLFRPRTAK